ncbi:MAG: recombinase family protein [Candidatus Omnitrophica bacterium]|nr:recombinase family protein [Candidatus Omnitrophota bacterium]MBU1047056.1 recombinase family protein [Candidatus Omnitrophota bacterium]MBU1889274.1 recombinase family protein [Candidatus Omnitrophota bacterium]
MEKKSKQEKKKINCAIYTRVSTSEGLEQEFTSLDNQRESAENYIQSQKSEGWVILPEQYDDAGYTGANTDRPALQKLMTDIKEGKINCVLVYKVDRLSRSLLDFSQLLEFFDKQNVAFVSVTQAFNTNTSMGRLTLNILLSFAQFEREIISERTRDKMGAAKKKGKWIGGRPPLGYDLDRINHKLLINKEEAQLVKEIFRLYIEKRSLLSVAIDLNNKGCKTKTFTTLKDEKLGNVKFTSTSIQRILRNVFYIGKVSYHGKIYDGEQERIISDDIFNQAQEMLTENRREKKINSTTKNIGLLSHILYCKACNSSMYLAYSRKGKYRYQYYLCMNAQKRGYESCPTRLLAAQVIENKFIECLRQIEKETKLEATVWDNLALGEKIQIIKSLVKQVSYDANNGTLEILFQKDGRSHSFDVKLNELKRIPHHKRKDGQITKEPAIRRNLILAHQIEKILKEKKCSLRQLVQWSGIPLPKICEIANMLNISPKIQEEIIFSQDENLSRIPEYKLRPIISEIDWEKQQQIWDSLLKSA